MTDVRTRAPRWARDAYTWRDGIETPAQWRKRSARIRRNLLVSAGLWPEPTRTALQAVVHGRKAFDGYTVEKVYFQSMPGHYVTGSLYRPVGGAKGQRRPGVLCPYGHWPGGRFMDYLNRKGHYGAAEKLRTKGEELSCAARSLLQARCVHLARMGCVVLVYDMIGRADSIQMGHPDESNRWEKPGGGDDWVLESPRAIGRLQSMFGLQTWNGIRAVDFLLTLEDVDAERIFVTGASGGGKQTIYLMAADQRVSAGVAGVALGGGRFEAGCLCGKAPQLLVEQGLVDLVASCAPRPFALSEGADRADTGLLPDVVEPYLKRIYGLYGRADNVETFVNVGYGHTYNLHARRHMYGFVNRHFKLGLDPIPAERAFELLSEAELTVWDDEHAKPEETGESHEKRICRWWRDDAQKRIGPRLSPRTADELAQTRRMLGPGWSTILGREGWADDAVRLEVGEPREIGGARVRELTAQNVTRGELVRARIVGPDRSERIVIRLGPDGADSLRGQGGAWARDVRELLGRRCAVVGVDLLGQSASPARPTEGPGHQWAPNSGKVRKGKSAAPSHVYAHHPPLVVRRVHDVLTLLKGLEGSERWSGVPVSLSAPAGVGPVGLGVLAQAGPEFIDRAAIDLDGFTFASVRDVWAADFLPGALKYGDVIGLSLLAAPRPMLLNGASASHLAAIGDACMAAGAPRPVSSGHEPDRQIFLAPGGAGNSPAE